MSDFVLVVDNLSVAVGSGAGAITLVEQISFSVRAGEIMALVGESGSGKSITALALMGLLEKPLTMTAGQIALCGQPLDLTNAEAMRSLRGRQMAMIFQDPMMTLNPVMRIVEQVCEAMYVHNPGLGRAEAHERARDALGMVGIAAPEERLAAYPHQLSGGMRQRVVIAIALINRPALVIADEPTTALDVTTQGQILHEAQRLCKETGTAMIWITHDLAVVANLAQSIAVMYAGRIVEHGPAEAVLAQPQHPYTRGLLDSVPMIDSRIVRLRSIPGMPPSVGTDFSGCRFAPRCARVESDCFGAEPQLAAVPRSDVLVRCVNPLGTAMTVGAVE